MRIFVRYVAGAYFLLMSAIAMSASVTLTWTEPTENQDGSLLTDLASYEIHSGCTISGVYDRIDTLSAPATTYVVDDIFGNTCYFAAIAVNSQGVGSAFSNEATKVLSSLQIPDPPSSLSITWAESKGGEMAFAQIASVTVSHSADAAETSTQVDFPASGIVAGDLLLAIWSNDGSGDTPTWPVGDWADNALFIENANSHGASVSYIFADGTENGGSITVTHPNEGTACFMLHITGAHASTPPEVGARVSESGDDWPVTTLTPLGWSADNEDTLYIGYMTNDNSNDAITGYPTEIPDNQNYSGAQGTGISGVAFGSAESATASYSTSDTLAVRTANTGARAAMIAIRPSAGGGGGGRIMSSIAGHGGLAGAGGIAGHGGGLAN